MTVAIHQPYFFPYVGYFQLIRAVDAFVFLDDVAFRKQGWINRNRLLIDGAPRYVSVPLSGASSSVPINRTSIDQRQFPEWRRRFLRTLGETYAGAPDREAVLDLTTRVLDVDAPDIGALARESVAGCCRYLGVATPLLSSAAHFPARGAGGAERVLQICRALGASTYVNAPGGRDLYDREVFARVGVELRFLEPQTLPDPTTAQSTVAGLSILDLLMREGRDAVRRLVCQGRVE
jgi:hypothetical protein